MKKRVIELDYLKVLAIIFVVLLHVSSYVWQVADDVSKEVYVMYHIIQALAYPAIHLFVLIGSYFLIDSLKDKRNQYIIFIIKHRNNCYIARNYVSRFFDWFNCK